VDSPGSERRNAARGAWAAAILLVAVTTFAFQGSRGLWEPDEGFYANAIVELARGGSLLVPTVNGAVFLDKPPLLYWVGAIGVRLLGEGEWGLRLANAIAIMLTAIAAGALAGRVWGRSRRAFGTVAYAVMIGPYVASNVLPPDPLLACFVAAALYSYWRSVTAEQASAVLRWELMTGIVAGLGALTKGPAVLVFVAPLLLHALATRGWRGGFRTAALVLPLAAVLAALWYATVMIRIPRAAAYIWDNQVWGRLVSARYARNASWAGPLKVYLPMLVVGTVPWTARLWRFTAQLVRGGLRRRRWSSAEILLGLCVLCPLIVLSIARSRLPLYLLPMFTAVAVIAARPLHAPPTPGRGRRFAFAIGGWVVALVALKASLAYVPIEARWFPDSRALAGVLQSARVRRDAEVVMVDAKRNGLVVYGYRNLTWTRYRCPPYPFFEPPLRLENALRKIETHHPRQVALVLRDPDVAGDVVEQLPGELRSCSSRINGRVVVLECPPPRSLAR